MASPLLSYAEAAERVHRLALALFKATETGPEPELVSLEFSAGQSPALGRVLATPILADRDQPPFPRSTRDGFACRADEASTHQPLPLTGHIRAGEAASGILKPGEAWEIMTGAPVPQGADAVFMVEHAEVASGQVCLLAPRTLQPGENVVPQGSEARANELLVAPGTRITPAQIAMAAQCGYAHLEVFRRPRVAILSTGDELVPVSATPGPSQIRNSNSPMLAALVASAGAVPILLPTATDHGESLDAALAQALSPGDEHVDLLLITGGISAGKFDLVDEALNRLGTQFSFRGVALQPGKPVAAGHIPRPHERPNATASRHHELPFFALPGNPISSAVTFHLFAAPILAALARDVSLSPRFALAQLVSEWRGKPGLSRFLPAWCDFGASITQKPQVHLVPWQGSGDIAALARSNCFLAVSPAAEQLEEGAVVQILLP